MKRCWSLIVIGFGVVLLLSCGNTGSSSSSRSVRGIITVEGGEIVTDDGDARLSFPPGAVTDDTEVTIVVDTQSQLQNLVTDLYELSPSGVQFQEPVTLTIIVGASSRAADVFLAKVVDGQPVAVEGYQYNRSNGELTADLTSFSDYGGFAIGDTDQCTACTEAQCSEPLQACEGDPDCSAVLECFSLCIEDDGDAGDCVETCSDAHPAGLDLFDAVGTCVQENCSVCLDEGGDDEIRSISFEGTLYVHPQDSIDGLNTVWGLQGTVTGASSPTDGASNTHTVVDNMGVIGIDYAAKICDDLVSHDYDDWYLPSQLELNALYENQVALGGFEPLYYWSSTESDLDNAWIQNFLDGASTAVNKGLLARIRCVRRNP